MNHDPIDNAVRVLNEALIADQDAIQELMSVEVRANRRLEPHPTIQVWRKNKGDDECVLRPIGLINGLFGVDEDGCGYIAMVINEDKSTIERFIRIRSFDKEENKERLNKNK